MMDTSEITITTVDSSVIVIQYVMDVQAPIALTAMSAEITPTSIQDTVDVTLGSMDMIVRTHMQ